MATQQRPDIQAIRAAILGAAAQNANKLIWLGILLIVLGIIGVAGQVFYSFISISILGAFAIIGGVLQAAHAMHSHGWKSVTVQWFFALFYIAAGVCAWVFPIPALEGLTIWLAAVFFITGVMRFIQAFHHRLFNEWFWLLISSAISILMGILIMRGWPTSSLWLPGLLLAVEFLLQGWSLLFLGFAAKSAKSS